jgi:hypothetical protein
MRFFSNSFNVDERKISMQSGDEGVECSSRVLVQRTTKTKELALTSAKVTLPSAKQSQSQCKTNA